MYFFFQDLSWLEEKVQIKNIYFDNFYLLYEKNKGIVNLRKLYKRSHKNKAFYSY
jgi:hypothetical protein